MSNYMAQCISNAIISAFFLALAAYLYIVSKNVNWMLIVMSVPFAIDAFRFWRFDKKEKESYCQLPATEVT